MLLAIGIYIVEYAVWCVVSILFLLAAGLVLTIAALVVPIEAVRDSIDSVSEFLWEHKRLIIFSTGLMLSCISGFSDGAPPLEWWIVTIAIALVGLSIAYLHAIEIIGREKQSHFIDGDEGE